MIGGRNDAAAALKSLALGFQVYVASGYFAIWLADGVGIYALGVAFATVAMRSELFSRSVPLLSGAS